MSNDKEELAGCLAFWFGGASITAILGFFGTWIAAIVFFNFLGLALGWIPAIIVAVVLYFTAPFLYALIGWLLLVIFIGILLFLFVLSK